MNRAEQPEHGGERAEQRQDGQDPGARVVVDRGGGEDEGQGEEPEGALCTLGDLAHHGDEAEDVDVEVLALVLLPDLLLDPLGELQVVEPLLRLGVDVQELGRHHRGRVVLGDQTSDEAALDDVAPDHLDVLVVHPGGEDIGGDHVVGDQPLLGDLEVAGVGRPDRGDRSPVDAREEEDVVGQRLQLGQEGLGPDVALLGAQHEDDSIRAEEPVLILEEGLDVLVISRKLLLEAGIHAELGGEVAHHRP